LIGNGRISDIVSTIEDETMTDAETITTTTTTQPETPKQRKTKLQRVQEQIAALKKIEADELADRAEAEKEAADKERARINAARLAAARPLGFAFITALRNGNQLALDLLPTLLEKMPKADRIRVEARVEIELGKQPEMPARTLGPKLTATYADRKAVKALGAVFIAAEKSWFVPGDVTDLAPFKPWLPATTKDGNA
jgi:hypothetical protein